MGTALPVDLEEDEETMTMPPVRWVLIAPASHPVHSPAHLRPAPVKHVTGGPGHRAALAVANGWMRPYSSWLIS